MATEFVGIELELRGEEGVYNDLKKIQSLMDSLGGRKKVDAGLNDARRQVVAYRGELQKLQQAYKNDRATVNQSKQSARELMQAYREGKISASEYRKEFHQLSQTSRQAAESARQGNVAIGETKQKMMDAQQGVRIFQQGIREAGKTFQQTATSIASRARQIGGSMQSMGNALTRMTSPFTRLTTGLLYGAGYKALNMITSGISGAFERYDTMQTYEKALTALGLDATKKFVVGAGEAQTAIENLNDAVLGLPTGLDEIVAAQKVYAGATGEMEKSTKVAIAANNAFIASGTNAREQRFMQRYLAAMASGAEVTAMQWQSMGRIAPLALKAVADELGVTTQAIRAGQVAEEDFLDAFIKVGTEGKLQAAANVMKTTWEGLSANIQNATKRMGEGILKALDDAFVSYNGRNFVQNLLGFDAEGNEVGGGIKHWINDISASIQEWIRSNPDTIIDFFNDLKKIDIKGFLKGLAEGYGMIADAVRKFANFLDGRSLESFAKGIIKASILGKMLTIAGGLVRGSSQIIGKLGALATRVGKLGIFGKIASLFGGLTGLKKAKGVADKVPSFGTSFKRAFASMADTLAFLGTIAVAAGTGFAVFRSVKTIIKDLKSIADELNTMTPAQWATATEVLQYMTAGLIAFATAADAIGLAVGSLGAIAEAPMVVGSVVTAIIGAMAALVSAEVMAVFKSFERSTKYLKDGLKHIEELGNIKFNKKKVGDALGAMKDIMGAFDTSYDEGGSAKEGTGKTHTDWSANSNKFKNITKNIADAVQSMKDILNDLNTLPDMDDKAIEKATSKVEKAVESMKSVYSKLMEEIDLEIDKSKGSEKWQRSKNEGVVKAVADIVKTIKNSMNDLKALEKIDVNFEQALGNATRIGKAMGELFASLNTAFGQEFITDSDGSFVQKTNEGVTSDQKKKASNLKQLFDSYKETISSIRNIYESLMGKEGDMDFNADKFKETMEGITGEDGILSQLKGLWDGLLDEKTGFGEETDVDLEGIMSSFATAVGSIKQAVTTLSEIGEIEFEGDGGISSIVASINQMVSDLKNAFNEEVMGELTAQIEAFKTQINSLKQTIESLGGEGGEGIKVSIELVPDITGDDVVVQTLQDAHDAIEEQIEAIKALSQAINIEIPISVSLPGLDAAVARIYSAASRLSAAKSALNSAKGGIYVATGGYIGSGGRVLYRSKGGDTMFKPRGTDTVPAMLTPGEYVTRKRAVDFFGIDFMRKINDLNVKGAMADLMTMAGHMANVGSQTIINNTYNNNQKVIQNVNTNSPDFAFKSASRFAGAF